jgi:hypothetical protein
MGADAAVQSPKVKVVTGEPGFIKLRTQNYDP